MNNPPRILYCHCANARVLPAQTRAAVLRKLCDAGLPFDAVPDLCALSARRDPLLQEFAASGSVVVAACHPRAVSGLFAAAAASLSPGTTKFLDLRSESPQSICTALCEIPRAESARRHAISKRSSINWNPPRRSPTHGTPGLRSLTTISAPVACSA